MKFIFILAFSAIALITYLADQLVKDASLAKNEGCITTHSEEVPADCNGIFSRP